MRKMFVFKVKFMVYRVSSELILVDVDCDF